MARCVIVLALALFPSLASAGNCPLPIGQSRGWFDPWKTQQRLVGFVWSNTGDSILGVQRVWEEKRVISLFGWKTVEQKVCNQLYWTGLDSPQRTNLGAVSEGEVDFYQTFAFPQAGYALSQVHTSRGYETQRIDVATGQRTTLATIDGRCDSAQPLPSPTGDVIAFVHSTAKTCSTISGGTSTTVSFFGQPGQLGPFDFAGSYITAAWTPAGALVLTDGTAAYSISGSVVTPIAAPTCMTPPTTSSNIDGQGRQLDNWNDQAHVIGTDPSRAFGCP